MKRCTPTLQKINLSKGIFRTKVCRTKVCRTDNMAKGKYTDQILCRIQIYRKCHKQKDKKQKRRNLSIQEIYDISVLLGQVRLGWLPFRCLLAALQVPASFPLGPCQLPFRSLPAPIRCLIMLGQVRPKAALPPVGFPLGACSLPFRSLPAPIRSLPASLQVPASSHQVPASSHQVPASFPLGP